MLAMNRTSLLRVFLLLCYSPGSQTGGVDTAHEADSLWSRYRNRKALSGISPEVFLRKPAHSLYQL